MLGFAGRINDPRKNVGLLIDALALARERGEPLTLRMTGSPGPELWRRIAKRGMGDHVTFVGTLSRAELPAFYRSLDVFVIPSRQEGLGIVGVEAMACGVPVVSTRNGGAEDYVRDGENGFLTSGHAGEVADRILMIVHDRVLRGAMSRCARDTVAAGYSHEVWSEILDAAWERVWGERP